MAEIDIYILDLFVRYILPFLILYIFIYRLTWGIFWKPLINFIKMKLFRYTLNQYWTKIKSCNKKELERMFAPLHELKSKKGQRLRIMEIGIGEGSNFSHYPPNCDVYCVDPEEGVEPGLRENISKFDGLELKSFKTSGAEDMSHIENNSMDAVICTLVLCSVKNPQTVVQEVKRILRKGGTFLFWEHIYAVGNIPIRTMQWLITNLFWFVPFSCNLTLEASGIIEGANFSKHEYVKSHMAVMPLDGIFIFWEHVYASNDKSIARQQWILNGFWKILFSGCHLTRRSSEYIEAANFSTHDFSTISLPVWSIIRTTLFGIATK